MQRKQPVRPEGSDQRSPQRSRGRASGGVAVVLLWPELLGTYGDAGNARVLAERIRRRGIGCRVVEVPAGRPVPQTGDIYLLGGGEDGAQSAAGSLGDVANSLRAAIDRGAFLLGVCAGFQLLGEYFTNGAGVRIPGLGLLDVRSGRLAERAIGEVVSHAESLELPALTGFENHGGATELGPEASALGRVIAGVGNGCDGAEGAVADGIVGTYLHGPVLARNPALADYLIAQAIGIELAPLDDDPVKRLRRERLGEHRDEYRGAHRVPGRAALSWLHRR